MSVQKIEGKPSVPAKMPPRTGPIAMENWRTVDLLVFEFYGAKKLANSPPAKAPMKPPLSFAGAISAITPVPVNVNHEFRESHGLNRRSHRWKL